VVVARAAGAADGARHLKQPSTRSPTATELTASPAATTVPTYSWPMVKPGLDGHAAVVDVQVAAAHAGGLDADDGVVGCLQLGSGRSSTRTSPGAWKVTACIRAAR
jgi:hypothetical protein